MPYTKLQNIRWMRAKNKGQNRKLAAKLHAVAALLEQKGPEEFSRAQITALQRLRELLTARLYTNAMTQAMQILLDGGVRKVGDKYRVDLDKRDL
jgi:imidazole glycerol phosphate synthase subunit HisF